jgi:membrane associated rhomboid family serine protease
MSDTQDTNNLCPAIPARSKRMAMDWSLVLASQDIAAIINHTETGWELVVEPPDLDRARAVLAQYQMENRGWPWRQKWDDAGLVFHWGALFWVLWMGVFYYGSMVRFPGCQTAGIVDSHAIWHGEWWRLFTAVTLHENLPHLLGNSAMGFLLLGLAMARFGPGIAVLAAFLAGAAGNLAAVIPDPAAHYSLGASGMVTGALGLITVQTFVPGRKDGRRPLLSRGMAAGVLILVLISFSPGTDMVAHVGGFGAGALFGLALNWIPPAALQRTFPNAVSGVILAGLVLVTWLLACRG